MKTFRKKAISLLLSAAMLVGLIPTGALAVHSNGAPGSSSVLAEAARIYLNNVGEHDEQLPLVEEFAEEFAEKFGKNPYPETSRDELEHNYINILPITPEQVENGDTIDLYSSAEIIMSSGTAGTLAPADTPLDIDQTKFLVLMAVSDSIKVDTDTDFVFNSTFLMPDEDAMKRWDADVTVTRDTSYQSSFQSDTAIDMRWKISGALDELRVGNQGANTSATTTEGTFDFTTFFQEKPYLNNTVIEGTPLSETLNLRWGYLTGFDPTGVGTKNYNVNLYAIPVKMNWSALVDAVSEGEYSFADNYQYAEGDEETAEGDHIYDRYTVSDYMCPMFLSAVQEDGTVYDGIKMSIDLDDVELGYVSQLREWTEGKIDNFIPTEDDIDLTSGFGWYFNVDAMPIGGVIVGNIYQYDDADKNESTLFEQSNQIINAGTILTQFAYATPGSINITKTIEGLPGDAQMPESLAVTITDQNGNPARDLSGNPVTASIEKDDWTYSDDGKWTATITVNNLRPSDETYGWDYQYTVNVADEGEFDGYTRNGEIVTTGNEGLTLENQYTLSRSSDGTIGYTKTENAQIPTVSITSKYTQNAPDAFTLTYKANGGVGDDVTDTYPLDDGASSADAQIKDNMFTREGYTFTGWADASGEKYAVGSTIALSANLILYAQWSRDAVWNGQPVDKTATQLDENYESNVTLSLPAAGYQKEADVVFAIDCTSVLENNSAAMAQALAKMAQELMEKDNIVLNVGVVGFGHNADVLADLQEVNAENMDAFMANLAEEFKNSLTNDSQIDHDGGTNLQVGIRTARQLLDDSATGAMPQNRYLVLMTDGAGFYYCRSDTDNTSVCTVHNDTKQCLGNMDANADVGGTGRMEDSMYMRATEDGKTFGDFIAEQGAAIEASAVNSFSKDEAATAPDDQCYTTAQVQNFDVYPYLNMERGAYFAAQELLMAEDAGYQLVTIGYPYKYADILPSLGAVSSGFRDWIKTIGTYYDGSSNLDSILGSISNELGQFVDQDSQIMDEIGSGTDSQGNPYDFNFMNDANRLRLTVGGTTLNVTQADDTTYNFGTEADPDQFVLHYYANGTQFRGKSYGECFVLDINVPVTMEQPVTLTYAVDLTNPQTEPGTYSDLDTNNSATLYPVDSDGNALTPVVFPVPTVSYTEEEPSGGGAQHPEYDPDDDDDNDDGDDEDDTEEIIEEEVPLADTPWLNTTDHYAYIVGYPEDYVTGEPTEDESRWPVKPQANITRAEVATIFFRLLTDEARDQFWMTTNNFPDVQATDWYNNAISTMVNAGIIQGYEDGTFRPNNNITRAEFAAIASRFMSSGYDVEEDLFTDIANHWARNNINDAAMTQWIHGYPDGTFRPDQAITRAEAVTLVNNVLQRKPDADHLLDSMIKWPDNMDTSAWYYEAIQEATNSHDYDLFEGAEYETWTALQENRDWAALEKDWLNAHRTGGEVM